MGTIYFLIIVFFFGVLLSSANGINNACISRVFISEIQSQLIAWAFYSYFVGSIIFFLGIIKSWCLQKFGYKRHYLLVYYFLHFGSFMFLFLQQWSFPFFLPLYLQWDLVFNSANVANPLAIKMGSPDTGAHHDSCQEESTLLELLLVILLGIALFRWEMIKMF
jgi:FHS family L-fucose permease-like MFS transporter